MGKSRKPTAKPVAWSSRRKTARLWSLRIRRGAAKLIANDFCRVGLPVSAIDFADDVGIAKTVGSKRAATFLNKCHHEAAAMADRVVYLARFTCGSRDFCNTDVKPQAGFSSKIIGLFPSLEETSTQGYRPHRRPSLQRDLYSLLSSRNFRSRVCASGRGHRFLVEIVGNGRGNPEEKH